MDYRKDHYIDIKICEDEDDCVFPLRVFEVKCCSLYVHEYDDYGVPLYRC